MGCDRLRVAPYLISPASLGSVRLICGMQMMSHLIRPALRGRNSESCGNRMISISPTSRAAI